MSYDIYGNTLMRGHCEVHPHVREEYPCSVCIQENNSRNAHNQSESDHYVIMRLEHDLELSQQRIAELEQRNNELDATVEWLREVVKSAVSVFSKYEGDVDDYPTLEHRAFMETLKGQCK